MYTADIHANLFTGNEDFYAKFWREKFKGGTPGAPGNVLMAVGQVFISE